ncbi:unnamed protein product [Rhizophagus irregularis]|nr:unnamed protein product [Rhizophagus irregularis]CAB5388845.1 unnamed protein product [Rhizophagus irregularis]
MDSVFRTLNSQYDNWFYIVQDRFPIYKWIGWKWISGSWVDWMKPKELLRWFQNFPITFIDRNPCVFFIVGIHVILSMMKQIEVKF